MTKLELAHFRTADDRLRWLLDEYPEVYLQIVLFPMGCHYANDQVVWQTFSPQQKRAPDAPHHRPLCGLPAGILAGRQRRALRAEISLELRLCTRSGGVLRPA